MLYTLVQFIHTYVISISQSYHHLLLISHIYILLTYSLVIFSSFQFTFLSFSLHTFPIYTFPSYLLLTPSLSLLFFSLSSLSFHNFLIISPFTSSNSSLHSFLKILSLSFPNLINFSLISEHSEYSEYFFT